jgi:hypothetical protein
VTSAVVHLARHAQVIGFLAQSFGLLNAFWLVVVLLAVGFAVAGVLKSRATPKLA